MAIRFRSLAPTLSLCLFIETSAALAGFRNVDLSGINAPRSSKLARDLDALEEVGSAWVPPGVAWPFSGTRAEAGGLAEDVCRRLDAAKAEGPAKLELLLARGVAAHYAFNLDRRKPEAADGPLKAAEALRPSDPRGAWFLGYHFVYTRRVVEGMQKLMALARASKALPASFWRDYAQCALVARMPSNAPWAAEKLRQPNGALNDLDATVVTSARAMLEAPVLGRSYPSDKVWDARTVGDRRQVINRMFGLAFEYPTAWYSESPTEVDTEMAIATWKLPLQAGRKGTLGASIVIIARRAQPSATLQQLAANMFPPGYHSRRVRVDGGPSAMIALEATSMNVYPEEGGAHVMAALAEAGVPSTAGLRLEVPSEPPTTDALVAAPRFVSRIEGRIFYQVLLDSAESIFPAARADWERLVRSLVIE